MLVKLQLTSVHNYSNIFIQVLQNNVKGIPGLWCNALEITRNRKRLGRFPILNICFKCSNVHNQTESTFVAFVCTDNMRLASDTCGWTPSLFISITCIVQCTMCKLSEYTLHFIAQSDDTFATPDNVFIASTWSGSVILSSHTWSYEELEIHVVSHNCTES